MSHGTWNGKRETYTLLWERWRWQYREDSHSRQEEGWRARDKGHRRLLDAGRHSPENPWTFQGIQRRSRHPLRWIQGTRENRGSRWNSPEDKGCRRKDLNHRSCLCRCGSSYQPEVQHIGAIWAGGICPQDVWAGNEGRGGDSLHGGRCRADTHG